MLSGIQSIRRVHVLQIQADDELVRGRPLDRVEDLLDRGAAQFLLIQTVADGIQVRLLGELHCHYCAAPEVNPVNQPAMNGYRDQASHKQGDGDPNEVPLFPHPIDLGFVKKLHLARTVLNTIP